MNGTSSGTASSLPDPMGPSNPQALWRGLCDTLTVGGSSQADMGGPGVLGGWMAAEPCWLYEVGFSAGWSSGLASVCESHT